MAVLVGPTDQRSKIGTFNIAPSWTRLLSANAVFTLGAFVRRDQLQLLPEQRSICGSRAAGFAEAICGPEPDAHQRRRPLRSFSMSKGMNNIKAGVTYEQTFLDGKGYARHRRSARSPCSQTRTARLPRTAMPRARLPAPILLPYDLTRGGSLLHLQRPHRREGACALHSGRDHQRKLVVEPGFARRFLQRTLHARQAEPRLGVAYNIKKTNTILRASYARTLESPFNENLILSSIGCENAVLNPAASLPSWSQRRSVRVSQ